MKEENILKWLELMANLAEHLARQCSSLRKELPDGWYATDEALEHSFMKFAGAHERLALEVEAMKGEVE